MPVIKPLMINADAGLPAYSGEDLRRGLSGLLVRDSRTTDTALSGALDFSALAVSLSGTTVNVAGGPAVVGSTKGAYFTGVQGESMAAGNLAASDATNPRKDLVILEVLDPDNGGAAGRDAQLRIITGTAAATPARPATPVLSLALAEVTVPAGTGTPTVLDLRDYASPAGGAVWVRDAAHRDTLPLFDGLRVARRDWQGYEETYWAATGWDGPARYALLSAGADWAFTGRATIARLGSKRRVSVDVSVERLNTDTTIAQAAYASFGAVLPTQVRGTPDSGVINKVAHVAGSTTSASLIGYAANPQTGDISIRGLDADAVLKVGVKFTLQFFYHIT